MKKIFNSLFIVLLLTACEQPTDWQITPSEIRPVIEAILTDELKTQEIRLTQSFGELNEAVPAITDALILVSANGRTVRFLHETDGLYKSEEPFKIVKNLVYTLEIKIDDEEYVAQNQLSTVAPMPEITFRQYQQTDSLLLNDIGRTFNPNQQAMYDISIDWAHRTNEGTTSARLLFYTFDNLDISQVNPIRRAPVPFPRGSIVKVKKFGLNEDFADYLRALNIETDWNGAFFYTSGFDLPTNISNDGLGFFATCAVVEKTVIAR